MVFIKFFLVCCIAFICGCFGAYGGAKNKSVRRYGISALATVIVTSILVINFGWIGLVGLTVMSLAGILSLGYGIPDENDKGSAIGRFYYNLFNKNHADANFYTRLTICVLLCLCFLSIPILTAKWWAYANCSILSCLCYMLFSCVIENEGTFKIGDIEFLVEEFFIYFGFIGVFIMLIFFV